MIFVIKMKEQQIYSSEDVYKLDIFDSEESIHLLLFEYLPEEEIVRVTIRTGEIIDGTFDLDIYNDCLGRKHESLIAPMHYFQRIIEMQATR